MGMSGAVLTVLSGVAAVDACHELETVATFVVENPPIAAS